MDLLYEFEVDWQEEPNHFSTQTSIYTLFLHLLFSSTYKQPLLLKAIHNDNCDTCLPK